MSILPVLTGMVFIAALGFNPWLLSFLRNKTVIIKIPETVLHGVTGFKWRVFEEFCWAVKNIHRLRPQDCREWSEKNYSMDRIGKMYEEYFQRVNRLFDKGWYEENEERRELEWLKRYYPGGEGNG